MKVYKASAGAGKTYTLAKEFIKETVINDYDKGFKNILAVTFTRDATGEMKERIIAELYGLAYIVEESAGFLADIKDAVSEEGMELDESMIIRKAQCILNAVIHNYSDLHITTIDSFFQKIMRNIARELGVGSKFNIEMNSADVRRDAVNYLIENAHRDKQLLNWLTDFAEDRLEQNGNWRFRDDVYLFSSCIYNELFQRNESELKSYMADNPKVFDEILNKHNRALKDGKNFFKVAYRKAVELLENNGLTFEDIKWGGNIAGFWKKMADSQSGNISDRILKYCGSAEEWAKAQSKRLQDIVALASSELMPLLKKTVDAAVEYNTSALIRQNIHQLGLVWNITKVIDGANRENNRVMLSDTALFLNRMIDDSDSPFIYEKIGAEIKHILIDEFQDTSHLQWENFRTLLLDIIAAKSFCMLVGDVKQAIYRWRNGDWKILDGIEKEMPVCVENLPHNFRSEYHVVEFNNSFFVEAGYLMNEKYGAELTSLKNTESPFMSAYKECLVRQKPVKLDGNGFVGIDFLNKTDEHTYLEMVVDTLVERLQMLQESGVKANSICILTRKNDEISFLADALASKKTDFPELEAENFLNIVSDDAFCLSSSEAVRMIINTMRAIDNPALEYLSPMFKNQENQVSKQSWLYSVRLMPLSELVEYIFRTLKLDGLKGQSSYIFTFFDAIIKRQKNGGSNDLHSFIKYWDDDLCNKNIPASDGVDGIRAMTVHKSKGLQFHTVIIPLCNWEINPKSGSTVWCKKKPGIYDFPLLPVSFSSKMKHSEFAGDFENEMSLSWLDNINLLYVAFTRAEKNLIIFGKHKNKLDSIKTVSDILQYITPRISDENSDEEHFEFGFFVNGKSTDTAGEQHAVKEKNILKQKPETKNAEFFSAGFETGKSIFKQSNKSREFVNQNAGNKEKYISNGNIMHKLFERIQTTEDVEKAVKSAVAEGIVAEENRNIYITKILSAIFRAGFEDFFSDKYKIYTECSILMEENGEIVTRRPDRVLTSEKDTIIIDYKFGQPREEHKLQMQQYVDLLTSMNYPNITGYLWYAENPDPANNIIIIK
jgi:ATP-dependent exoDNAse (exonuclease V) beta subunit